MFENASSETGQSVAEALGTPGQPLHRRLRILHCLRAPVGGLFRHVRDLAEHQARQGHRVAVICDSTARDSLTAARLNALQDHLALGLTRTPMPRTLGWSDVAACRIVRSHAHAMQIDVLHGHGAKGGAYARLAARTLKARGISVAAVYTPHGGSLHFDPRTPQGALFMAAERHLLRHTDAAIFESAFARDRFEERVASLAKAAPHCLSRVINNGLADHDFGTHTPAADAADLLFVGELRRLKGVDILIEAIARVRDETATPPLTALIVGDGPDRQAFTELAAARGVAGQITFAGALPASEAFPKGRCLIVPSRAESLPYIVLEAAAARLPLIATAVGGIPEIVDGTATTLIPAEDPGALAAAIRAVQLDYPAAVRHAEELRQRMQRQFTVSAMASRIEQVYATALGSLASSASVAAAA